jgi:hypothetical protein
MAHFHVDGTLVVAKLKRNVLGGGVYQDVTVREEDGSHRNIGTLTVLSDMKAAMAPGTRGRFYVYDVLGSKGLYGARPVGAKARAYFPYRWDVMFAGMGALNLLMALGWWLAAGSFAPFAIVLGLLCLTMEALFVQTRIGAMRNYRSDDARVPSGAELRRAEART